MTEFADWFYSIPFFTRYWLAATIILSCIGRFGFIHPLFLYLDGSKFISDFQIWRPITALFFFPMSFQFLVNCYFLYSYSSLLETGIFGGKPADYCYMLLFNWFCCCVISLLLGQPVLMGQAVISVLYVWCLLNKDVVVTFWFGSRFRAMYLPWVLMIFSVVVAGSGLDEFIGIMVGHLAFFLLFKYPQEFGGPALLTPPTFLKQWFPDTRQVGGFGAVPSPSPARAQHAWGRGYALGGN